MTRTVHHPWLNKFAWLTAVMTFLLLGLGGLVTSHEAGLAVPDWPTSYGYNMFLFPMQFWRANILYEHTHRLLASFVGLLTTILAIWLWLCEPRRWLRWLGLAASLGVVLQGVLGGLRVTLLKDQIGIFHAVLAQSFFVMVALIALFLAGADGKLATSFPSVRASRCLRRLTIGSTILIFIQLILGASMRHQHAGLAVPDFPLAYGKVWPVTDAAFLEQINSRWSSVEQPTITAFQITLHMTHRLVALSIGIFVGCVAWRAQREQGARSLAAKLALAWWGMICIQAVLGAATVWSNKAAEVATAHVLVGALGLLMGTFLSVAMLSHARSRRVRTKTLDHQMTAPRSVIDFPEVGAMSGARSGGGGG
jgi:cytochrome c oxidase assembly protein subunit 15